MVLLQNHIPAEKRVQHWQVLFSSEQIILEEKKHPDDVKNILSISSLTSDRATLIQIQQQRDVTFSEEKLMQNSKIRKMGEKDCTIIYSFASKVEKHKHSFVEGKDHSLYLPFMVLKSAIKDYV